ncbi:MAG: hypothetical protein IT354_00265 [Gemmatimonadaceae bacterium]|nr:hypothetical protein [Gemmatimonadaceae bacterium]
MAADRLPRELRTYRAWALAHRMPDGVRDAAFPLLVQRIMRRTLHESEGVLLLEDGELAFRALVDAIGTARDEILLETYILRDDRIGESVRSALAAAVRRGVRVSVLADAVGSAATGDEFWEQLSADGITWRLFHRLRYLPFEALRRDHRKIVVIDRAVAFTGGMNIGEEYGSSIRRHETAWRDTLMRMEGSIARELAAVFAEGWDRAKGPPLPGLEYISWESLTPAPLVSDASAWSTRALRARLERRLAQRRDRRRGRRVRREIDHVSDGSPSTALVLDSRPGRGQREVLAVLASLVGAARKRLWITTPYFAPPTRALALLRAAARRGVDVRLLVPGERTDVALVRHAAHGAYHSLLDAGVRVFEYERATLHAKTLVVDGHAGVVGSTNLDFRSFWLNAECNVLLLDDDAAVHLERSFSTDCAHSTEITMVQWMSRSWRHRIGDFLARQLRWAL